MSLINFKLSKFFGWIFIFLLGYILFFFLVYVLSAIILTKKIYPDINLVREYQRNYYVLNLRNIWHAKKECIKFSKKNTFEPKETTCNFNNLEFQSELTFNKFGRFQKHPSNNNNNSIAVIGDSYAMGWGVNDNQTFSSILEKKVNRPVYNLAVSGYGTVRALNRLENSGLIDSVDTIIIQYCYNDYGENIAKPNEEKNNLTEKNFNLINNPVRFGFWKLLRKTIRYSVKIPFEILLKKNKNMDFSHHELAFINVLKKFPSINNKQIIVFYVNGNEMKFVNFPEGKYSKFKNLTFLNLNLEKNPDNFYSIDGHLNEIGHKKIALDLERYLINN